MIFTVIENFVFFSTLFALVAYGGAFFVRFGMRKNWWEISPFALTRIFAGLILMPPVFALWLVLAALLPETWLGSEVFQAAHITPVHEWHLLTDLTARFEPFLAYTTVLFLSSVIFSSSGKAFAAIFASTTSFVFWKSKRLRPRPEKSF